MTESEYMHNAAALKAIADQPRYEDDAWCYDVDDLFVKSMFSYDPAGPFICSPSGVWYYLLQWPTPQLPRNPGSRIVDIAIDQVVGVLVVDESGKPLLEYSPGDMVALKLYGLSKTKWQGAWNQPPNPEPYAGGKLLSFYPITIEVLPPLVGRCLEYGLRTLYKDYAVDPEEPPALILVREAGAPDEQPIDLLLRVPDLKPDSPVIERELPNFARRFLPQHIGLRLVANKDHEGVNFRPLGELLKSWGVPLAPDRN